MSTRRIYASGRVENRIGHHQYLDVTPTMRSVDNQAEILVALRRARAERDALELRLCDMVQESAEPTGTTASLWKRHWGKLSMRRGLAATLRPDQANASAA